MKNKIVAYVVVILLVLCVFPAYALAADQPITANGTYDLSTMSLAAGDTITIGNNLKVTLVGSTGTTYTNLRILSGSGSEVTLQNVNIDNTGYNLDTLVFFGTGNMLILSGTNNLTGGTGSPGVRVLRDVELEIKGEGVLNANGSSILTAGIGSGSDGDASGTITISGGTVNATGGNLGPGIGGNVHITGGTVTAAGSLGGDAIGSGNNSGATLTVDGCAELELALGGIESGMTTAFGDCLISGAGAGSLAGYYVNGVLFTGTVINMSTGDVTGGGATPGIDIVIINNTRDYLVTGSTALRTLRTDIPSGLPVDIILFGTSIKPPSYSALNAVIATVNLQLCGSNELHSNDGFAGLHCAPGAEVTISGDGTLTAESASGGAGIGGNSGEPGGKITIVSGTVTATGGANAAGIGGGNGGSGGTIAISGGTVTATGGSGGAGIGGGAGASGALVSCGSIAISGGTVNATAGANGAGIGTGQYGSGGTIEISGSANVTATGKSGEDGSGIGWGGSSTGGSITISGGVVKAAGTTFGAGLGGDANDGYITISGGNVTATGSGAGAAIGGAETYGAGTIKITGGIVDATSYRGAAIGCGALGAAEGTVEISGGTITADSKYYGTGIGTGQNSTAAVDVTISGTADVTASAGADEGYFGGAGIGSGYVASSCDVTILGGTVTATGALGAAGIGGGIGSDGGTITIRGGTVTATGNLYNEDGNDYIGAGIGGGAYISAFGGGASGSIAISGGVVYASGATGTYDIGSGSGYSGMSGSLSISGTAAVFMAHDSFLTSVTAATHTHLIYTTDTEESYGYSIPSEWTPTFGSYLRLYSLSYNGNSGSGTAPASATQLYNTTAAVADGSSLSRTNYVFDGWNTAADGSGTSYAAASTFTFSANTMLFAKWKAVPALGSSDADGKIYTGGRVTLTPNIAGGEWGFDGAYLSRDGGTFTALKTGTTTITYTVEGQSTAYEVTIEQSEMPATGQNMTWVLALIGAALILGAAGMLTRRRLSARTR